MRSHWYVLNSTRATCCATSASLHRNNVDTSKGAADLTAPGFGARVTSNLANALRNAGLANSALEMTSSTTPEAKRSLWSKGRLPRIVV